MFRFGHATHPNWQYAVELIIAQLEGQLQLEQFASDKSRPQRLGVVYLTDQLAAHAEQILATLRRKTGVEQWVGGVSEGICATGVEYYQEPALAAMIMELPADSARVFSGREPLPKPGTINRSGRDAMAAALVHVDSQMDDIEDLAGDLATKVSTGQVVGGLVSAGQGVTQIANQAFDGGMSGVLFSENVTLEIRLTQGCQPVGPEHVITDVKAQFALELDGKPALDILLRDLGMQSLLGADSPLEEAAAALAERFTGGLFVGLRGAEAAREEALLKFAGVHPRGEDYRVRPVVGLDPSNKALAIADHAQAGERLVFCVRDQAAARADLIRMCAELREELGAPAPQLSSLHAAGFSGMQGQRQPQGAIYIACNGRGAALFGQSGAELQIIREQLGDIPLVGFFANGEIRGANLYGFTGILMLIF